MPAKTYKDADASLLAVIKNPTESAYEVKIYAPEITFEGVKAQPDYGKLFLTFYPKDSVIELKSLKFYLQQFRDMIISYERLANVIYEQLMQVYKPQRMRMVMTFRPRGGISSRICIDSDWEVRGGEGKFWHHAQTEWAGKEVTLD